MTPTTLAAASAAPATPVWQNPYVEVIRYGLAHRSVGWHGQGDVEQETDKQIHKNVFKIRGPIASANFVRFPREVSKGNQGLGLTGRFVYIQLRRSRGKHVTLHLDVLTTKKTALRFSLSSMHTSIRSTGSVLRVPLELSETWTTLAIDLVEMLQLHVFNGYCRETHRYLKSVTCCSSMNLRNIITSSTEYTPATIPAPLALPASRENQCGPYAWLTFPATGQHKLQRSPAKSIARVASEHLAIGESDEEDHDWERGVSVAPLPVSTATAAVPQVTTVVSPTAVTGGPPLSPVSRETGLLRDREDVLSRADQIMRDAGFSVPSPRRARPTAGSTARVSPRRFLASEHSDWPDPILSLQRVVGFSHAFPSALKWLPDAAACVYACHSTLILRWFPPDLTNNTVHPINQRVTRPTSAAAGDHDQEEFLTGHTGEICVLEISRDGTLLATAQSQPDAVLRVWDLRNRSCIVVLKLAAKSVHALAFSHDAASLCAVGEDDHARTQLFVWDTSSLSASGTKKLALRARQTSDFPVHAIAFSPYEPDQLVSCGKENVRFWRIHATRHHLPGAPVILHAYSRGTQFTALAFDRVYPQFPSNLPRLRPVYVASGTGELLVVDYDSRQVVAVHQLHGAAIRSLCVNEGFCVSGADDKFLRVWPLDFGDFFLEAEHDAAVTSADISSDGLQVVVGTAGGAVGVLRLADQQYKTVLRSHTKSVRTLTPLADGSLVTSGEDGTLRVWDAATGSQTMEFDVSSDRVTCLAAKPRESEGEGSSQSTIAVGFHSGCTRIFTLSMDGNSLLPTSTESPRVVHEFQQHQSPLCDVQYQSDGRVLFTAGAGQQLCMYDASNNYTPLKMLIADMAEDSRLCLSRDKRFIAVVQSTRRSVLLLDAASLCVLRVLTPPSQLPSVSSHSKRGNDDVELTQLAISWHSQELLAVSKADRLYVFSLRERDQSFGSLLHSTPLLGQQGISSFALSPNLKYMANGGGDGSLRLWQCDLGQHKPQRMHQTFLLHAGTGAVRGLVFSRDGEYVIATSDSSSAIFVWRFRGNTSQLPALTLLSPTGQEQQELTTQQAPVPASKPAFTLPLDTIKSKTPERTSRGSPAEREENTPDSRQVEVVSLTDSSTRCVSVNWRQFGATSGQNYVWCCALGLLVSVDPRDSKTVVVEALESGTRLPIHLDTEAGQMVASSREKWLAILPATTVVDSVVLCDIRSVRESNQTEHDGSDVIRSEHLRHVALPQPLRSVSAITFTTDDGQLCMLGETISCGQRVLVVIDTACLSVRVCTVDGVDTAPVVTMVAQSKRELLFVQPGRAQPIQLVRLENYSQLTSMSAINALIPGSGQVKHVCYRDDGITERIPTHTRCRYWLTLDHLDLGCFLDLERQAVVLTVQFAVPHNVRITAIHWIGKEDWQAIVLATDSNAILVFTLPTRRPSGIVDWQQLRRVGRISCTHSISLPASQRTAITQVLTDGMSDAGVLVASDGSVFTVNFRSAHLRLLCAPVLCAVAQTARPRFAVHDALMLTLSPDHHSLQCWEPTTAREVARLYFPRTQCIAFTVSLFDSHLVLAVFEDESIRLLDVAEHRVVAQWKMPPPPRHSQSGKRSATSPNEALTLLKHQRSIKPFVNSPRSPVQSGGGTSPHHVAFIGPRCVIVVVPAANAASTEPRVVLFDFADIPLSQADSTPQAKLATRPVRKASRSKKEAEIQYRELTLPGLNGKRPTTFRSPDSGSASWQMTVESIDVQPVMRKSSPDADALRATCSFLVVARWAQHQQKMTQNVTVAHVFDGSSGAAGHPVYSDDDVVPTHSWLLEPSTSLPTYSQLAIFHPMHEGHVVSMSRLSSTVDPGANQAQDVVGEWCIDVRDALAQRILMRFQLPRSVGSVSQCSSLQRCRVEGRPLIIVSDTEDVAQFCVDLTKRTIIPVNTSDRRAQPLMLIADGSSTSQSRVMNQLPVRGQEGAATLRVGELSIIHR